METSEIRYFLALVRLLNFTRAAQHCGVSQPALTRAIQKLEAELGQPLFLRHPGKVELTDFGRTLVPRFEAVAESIAAAQASANEANQRASKLLRLGVMCTVGPMHIAQLIGRLLVEQPDCDVTLVEGRSSDIVEYVRTDVVDIGIAAWPAYPDLLSAQEVLSERFVLAMHPTHPLCQMDEVPLSALAGCQYLERLNCEFDAYFTERSGAWPFEFVVRFASEREDWIYALLANRLGVAIVPEYMSLPPGVTTRRLVAPETAREISLLTLRGRPLSPPARSFLRLSAQHRWKSSSVS